MNFAAEFRLSRAIDMDRNGNYASPDLMAAAGAAVRGRGQLTNSMAVASPKSESRETRTKNTERKKRETQKGETHREESR